MGKTVSRKRIGRLMKDCSGLVDGKQDDRHTGHRLSGDGHLEAQTGRWIAGT